ncbi:alpha/beta hydrolase [Lederbergia sp. NSJ-179]|uniref:alpha/beta hydrolase n=1 Tax=Lederbergia sp. NSJ-179 TaxID=2931402 RepID=UPI001FD470E4|nr:alpha/beta hydrolase [Lederbergia sp. NSJ-179]MCJ7840048.1 alpha/beta hydrolase [Lederbergia sp. NSJ-179]
MIHEMISIQTEHSEAKLYTYILSNSPEIDPDRKRPAVVICPGGGYVTTSDREAEPVAIQLNAMGFQVFVLRYSVHPATFPTALLELATSVALVRENAEKWHIDPNKVIVAGFSAGGHLAASLGVFWEKEFLSQSIKVDKDAYKPNGLILSYPVISSGVHAHQGSFNALLGDQQEELREKLSLEKQVNAQTPPTFLWHTFEDASVPVENSMLFAIALRKHNIPFELHIYPNGGHGLSLANEESFSRKNNFGIQKECQNWIEMAGVWIRNLA